MIKIVEFDEIQSELKNLLKGLKKLSETTEVGFLEVLSPNFIKRYTNFSNFEEMLKSSGSIIESEKDFIELEKSPQWNDFVCQNTKFNSWEEMIKTSADLFFYQLLDN